MSRRNEFIATVPKRIRAARKLAPDVREQVIDDAIVYVSVQYKPEITGARSGWEDMLLVKTTGSSFATFARDDFTTLPELTDRPLTIGLSVYWRYRDLVDGVAEGPGFLGPRAVRDEIERIFHEFNSRSIQHLVHEIGARLFGAHTQLQEIEFVSENHTPDHVRDGTGGVKIFAAPRGTFGKIGLVLRR